MAGPVDIDFPHLSSETDRHGNQRLYVRRYGRRIRLRAVPGTPAFVQAYAQAMATLDARRLPTGASAPEKPVEGTLGALWLAYARSATFRALDTRSQSQRRTVIESCLNEPRRETEPEGDRFRDCPLTSLAAKHVRVLRDRRAEAPGAANNRLKYLSAMFGWAVEDGRMAANPARDVKRVKYATTGFHTWTVAEVRQYEARHPVGTKARLALALLLFTGARRGDMVTLGRQHVREGWLRYVPRKTRHLRQTITQKPILPELQQVIDASPCGELTFLVTEYGRGFTAAGFGAWFRTRCDEAGLPHCTAHGLRKAGATIAAENGATDRQLMALYDWSQASEATRYTAAADRRRMAGEAMHLVSPNKRSGE